MTVIKQGSIEIRTGFKSELLTWPTVRLCFLQGSVRCLCLLMGGGGGG